MVKVSRRRRSVEARILEFFENAPVEVARVVLEIAREKLKSRSEPVQQARPRKRAVASRRPVAQPVQAQAVTTHEARSLAAKRSWEVRRARAAKAVTGVPGPAEPLDEPRLRL